MKNSPFKFLDSFKKGDSNLYFGREEETQEIYQKVFKSNLLLVYGASGTGKTSLIQCGLASQFNEDNWFSVYIKRQSDINTTTITSIIKSSITKIDGRHLDENKSEICQRIEGLYFDHFKPIYLIFDQLEELFILGKSKEQDQFYKNISDIVNSNLQCTVILIIREEYIAFLSAMEEVIPNLFDNRERIEKMRKKRVIEVVEKSCDLIPEIRIEERNVFLEKLVENLSEDELTVELTHLQVYLDKLYRNSEQNEGVHIFDMNLLNKTGKIPDVLAQFLEQQLQNFSSPKVGWELLKKFVTKNGTKKSASVSDIKTLFDKNNYKISKKDIVKSIQYFTKVKILKQVEETTDQYEFTHDSLANKTFEKLDAKERNLFDIQILVDQQYKSFQKKGVLLSKGNLLYIKPFLKGLTLTSDQKKFIKKSEDELTRKRKNRKIVISAIIALLSILTFVSIVFALKSNQAEQEIRLVYEKVLHEQRKRTELEINSMFDEAKSYMNIPEVENAKSVLDRIQKNDTSEITIQRIKEFKEKYNLK